MSFENLQDRIRFEIKRTDRLFEEYSTLINNSLIDDPDLVEVTALASILHSFYNGVENIFVLISKEIDRNFSSGMRWHSDLLIKMAEQTSTRNSVISVENRDLLKNYLGFRHFYRHSYSYFLKWEQLKTLIENLTKVWETVRSDFCHFINAIQNSED